MSPTVSELHELLREQLTASMTSAGWTVDVAFDTEPGAMTVGAFRRRMSEDFSATAEFFRTSLGADPPLEVSATVGVSFERAYRLWPAICDRERSEVTIDLGDLSGSSTDELEVVIVSNPGEAPVAARTLVTPVLERGMDWARQYATLDAMLEENRADPDFFEWEIEVVPVLLAAAGRLDEARAALAQYEASGREEVVTRQYKRFAYQLTRWLDDGGVLPEPPTAPVGDKLRFDMQAPSFSDVWRETRARREAVDAVRKASKGKDRDQLREMLATELGRRGLTETPLQIETQLDVMQASDAPLGRARLGLRGLKGLVGAGRGLRKILKEGVAPTPDWLEPPARASYPVRTNYRDWIEVPVDATAGAWLDRVLAAAPGRTNDTVNVDAWLAWEPEPPTTESRLAVHIGAERVATLDADKIELYRPEMDAAARREELPQLRARLTKLRDPARYLLELAAPRHD